MEFSKEKLLSMEIDPEAIMDWARKNEPDLFAAALQFHQQGEDKIAAFFDGMIRAAWMKRPEVIQ